MIETVSSTQLQLVAVVHHLASVVLRDHTTGDVAAACQLSRDQVYRTLVTLEHVGWAKKTGEGRWQIDAGITVIAEQVRRAAAERLQELLDLDGAAHDR